LTDLKTLLDFKEFKDIYEIENHFYKISQQLFYNFKLQTMSGQLLTITELELYIYHNNGFKEKTMHKHHSQITSGRFYIHRHHNNKSSFKKPSHMGIDITCGNPFSCYAGILIRETKKDDNFLSCSKTVLEMIGSQYSNLRTKKWDTNELAWLHKLDDADIFDGPVQLKKNLVHNIAMPVWSCKKNTKAEQNQFMKQEFKTISSLASSSKKHLVEVLFNNVKAA